jgi:hypothetical protein
VNRADLSADWLHSRVCELRRLTRRRLFDPAVELVAPPYAGSTGPRPLVSRGVPAAEPLDHALRVDLLLGLLGLLPTGRDPLHLVVTRPGPAVVSGPDLAWYAAWSAASEVAGRTAGTTAAVTRYGFVDVVTGRAVRTEPRRHRR